MYKYDNYDQTIVDERANKFRDQTARYNLTHIDSSGSSENGKTKLNEASNLSFNFFDFKCFIGGSKTVSF